MSKPFNQNIEPDTEEKKGKGNAQWKSWLKKILVLL